METNIQTASLVDMVVFGLVFVVFIATSVYAFMKADKE